MSEKQKKKKDKVVAALNFGNGIVSFASALLAIVLILYSGYVLYDSMAIEVSAFSSNSDLLKYKPSVLAQAGGEDDGLSLAEVNKDYRGWIAVDGEPASPIDYPVVQGKDDLYYASHDATGTLSLTGAIYLAAGNKADLSDSYNLLYGHHMDNGAMFGSLDNFKNQSYFDAHQEAAIATKDGTVYDITFFGLVSTDAYENEIYTVGNRRMEILDFLGGNREGDAGIGTKLLVYDEKVAKSSTKIIALSTCASADTNGRLVLFGKMTKRRKETPNPNPNPAPGPDTNTNTNTNSNTNSSTGRTGTGSSKPVELFEEDEQKEPVKLTVMYYEGSEKVFSDVVVYYTPGGSYYVVSPQKPGYDVDIQIVRGTIETDMTVIVRYIPKEEEQTLNIRYIYPDGTQAADSYSKTMPTNSSYNVPSPEIEGYKPLLLKVSGTAAPGSKLKYVVIYVPENQELSDPPTPLGFEQTFMQIGICFE